MNPVTPDFNTLKLIIGAWFLPVGDEIFRPTPFILPIILRVHFIVFEATPPSVLALASIAFNGVPALYTPTRPWTTLNRLGLKEPKVGVRGSTYQERVGYGWRANRPVLCDLGSNVAIQMLNLGANPLRVTATLVGEELHMPPTPPPSETR